MQISPPKAFSPLSPSIAHIWYLTSFTRFVKKIDLLEGLLTEKEKNRANRFIFAKDRQAFIISHGMLHLILARYLNISADKIVFSQNSYGKPFATTGAVEFSLSHTAEMALFAFSLQDAVGIDIEKVKPIKNYRQIARRFFSTKENTALDALSKKERQLAFFQCWTRKEAFIKALGIGLSYPLNKFSVDVHSSQQNWTLECEDYAFEAKNWTFTTPNLPSEKTANYASALAIAGNKHRICCFDLEKLDQVCDL